MKNITLALTLVSYLALATASATAATKVFLLGGQSNMSGFTTGLPTTSPYNAPQPDVQFWNYSNNGWIDLQAGLGDTANDIGPEVGFGYTINNLFPDDDIYLIKHGALSTSLAAQWNPNGSGAEYNIFKSRVNTAMADLTAGGLSPEIAGMIWMQGESDAYNATYGAAYEANLTNLINTVRSDFTTPDMQFVVGRITDLSVYGFPAVPQVRTAQETVPGVVGNSSWIDTDDIEQAAAAPGHYNAAGQIVLGTRFANEFTNDPGPGPTPDGTMAVQFDANSGTMATNANTIGWRFGVSKDMVVTQLGCLNGVLTTGDAQAGVTHQVGIYSEPGIYTENEPPTPEMIGELLATATVTNGAASSTEQWEWAPLQAPLMLTAGNVYRIATHPSGDKWAFNTTNHSVSPEILIGNDLSPSEPGNRVAAYELGNVLQYPARTIWDYPGIYDGIFGANFQFIEKIIGDANSDGTVDEADASILATNWLTATDATWGMGDFNDDGAVNEIDATLLAANWQADSAGASVPEPSTLVGLLGLCLAGLLVVARRQQ